MWPVVGELYYYKTQNQQVTAMTVEPQARVVRPRTSRVCPCLENGCTVSHTLLSERTGQVSCEQSCLQRVLWCAYPMLLPSYYATTESCSVSGPRTSPTLCWKLCSASQALANQGRACYPLSSGSNAGLHSSPDVKYFLISESPRYLQTSSGVNDFSSPAFSLSNLHLTCRLQVSRCAFNGNSDNQVVDQPPLCLKCR